MTYLKFLMKFFFSVDQKNSPLKPAMLTNRQLVGSVIFSTPIIIIGGQSVASLSLTLETVISQPGIQLQFVIVIYNPDVNPDIPDLTDLFGFTSLPTKFTEYWKILDFAFNNAYKSFPTSQYVILVEEGLLLAPDFLSFMATMQPVLSDSSLLGISAWNPNGYANVSSKPDIAYRINNFPGQGFLIRMETYIKELKHDMKACCNKPGWQGNWLETERWEREIIIPELSRVLRRPVGVDLEPSTPFMKALFHRIRATNLDYQASIPNADILKLKNYEKSIREILSDKKFSTIIKLSQKDLDLCCKTGDINYIKSNIEVFDKINVLSFKDIGGGLKLAAKCFSLFYEQDSPVLGEHQGMLRFTLHNTQLIVMSNKSPHFSIAPYNTTKLILPS